MNSTEKFITKRDNGTTRVTTKILTHSKTDQSFKDDCDINEVVRKFQKTGQISHLNKKQGVYADVSQIPDLMTASQQIRDAEDAFNALPATVRRKFRNNPEEMIEFLRDPQNEQEAIKLGLINQKPNAPKNDDSNDENSRTPKTHKKAPKIDPDPKPSPDTQS